jgi:transglutaminase-like putative cysteine protease
MTVRFWNRNPPDAAAAYWRAIVLWTYQQDSLQRGAWIVGVPGNEPRDNRALGHPLGDNTVSQEITIYPHLHRWLFALDAPTSLARPAFGPTNSFAEALPGDVLQLTAANGLLVDRQRYTVDSSTELAPADLPGWQRKIALALPQKPDGQVDLDPGVLALAARLRQNAPTVDSYILAILHYFRHEGFVYSDAPGQGGPHALAHFLLRDKIGFCEHYASAFGVLMRLGGYPTRLVVGYHGAQYNPYKNIYVVKQSNAHSWDEVWIEDEKRWRRVDPTTVISRTSIGLAEDGDPAANESLSLEVAHRRVTFLSSAALPAWMRRGMLEVQLRREEIEADWNDWVFSYDPQTQNRLAQALGFRGETRYLFATLSLAAVAVCALVLGLAMNRRRRAPVEDLYHRFCRHLARHGLPRAEWEGPLAYTDRAAEAFPDRRAPIHDLGLLVARTRYAPHPPEASRGEMRDLLLKAEGKRRT